MGDDKREMKSKYICGTEDFPGCGKQFEREPGVITCPYCGYLYVTWLNYNEMAKETKP